VDERPKNLFDCINLHPISWRYIFLVRVIVIFLKFISGGRFCDMFPGGR